MLELEKLEVCPMCGNPLLEGSTYCGICKRDVSTLERNYCLNPDCVKHNAYLPVGLGKCPVCGGATHTAE